MLIYSGLYGRFDKQMAEYKANKSMSSKAEADDEEVEGDEGSDDDNEDGNNEDNEDDNGEEKAYDSSDVESNS
jgi:hypothetical protein